MTLAAKTTATNASVAARNFISKAPNALAGHLRAPQARVRCTGLFGRSLRVPCGVEGEVSNETSCCDEHECDENGHGYRSSNLAMLASIRWCKE